MAGLTAVEHMHAACSLSPCTPDQSMPSTDTTDELFATDEFRMYAFKILPCAKRTSHDWTTCPFAHPGEKARRRDPRMFSYLAVPCPDVKQNQPCPRGDSCQYCHSVFEYWLHPSRYRTALCQNGVNCRRSVCFFAHSVSDLRTDPSHLNLGKTSDTDAPGAAKGHGSDTGSPAPQPAASPAPEPQQGGRLERSLSEGAAVLASRAASNAVLQAGLRGGSPAASGSSAAHARARARLQGASSRFQRNSTSLELSGDMWPAPPAPAPAAAAPGSELYRLLSGSSICSATRSASLPATPHSAAALDCLAAAAAMAAPAPAQGPSQHITDELMLLTSLSPRASTIGNSGWWSHFMRGGADANAVDGGAAAASGAPAGMAGAAASAASRPVLSQMHTGAGGGGGAAGGHRAPPASAFAADAASPSFTRLLGEHLAAAAFLEERALIDHHHQQMVAAAMQAGNAYAGNPQANIMGQRSSSEVLYPPLDQNQWLRLQQAQAGAQSRSASMSETMSLAAASLSLAHSSSLDSSYRSNSFSLPLAHVQRPPGSGAHKVAGSPLRTCSDMSRSGEPHSGNLLATRNGSGTMQLLDCGTFGGVQMGGGGGGQGMAAMQLPAAAAPPMPAIGRVPTPLSVQASSCSDNPNGGGGLGMLSPMAAPSHDSVVPLARLGSGTPGASLQYHLAMAGLASPAAAAAMRPGGAGAGDPGSSELLRSIMDALMMRPQQPQRGAQ